MKWKNVIQRSSTVAYLCEEGISVYSISHINAHFTVTSHVTDVGVSELVLYKNKWLL